MTAEHILALRQLWQDAFGDSDAFLDAFFATGFSPDRCHFLLEEDTPVSALYWFDCTLQGRKLAYLYAVATAERHRGKGLAGRLLEETHNILRSRGYSGALLVPGAPGLFDFYRKLGYATVGKIAEFSCPAGDAPIPLRQIDAAEYAHLRKELLPRGGVIQADTSLSFLESYCALYAGEDFLLAGECVDDNLIVQELLGNAAAAPGITRALNCGNGNFRIPGAHRDFAMFLPLADNCPTPAYFGLALD